METNYTLPAAKLPLELGAWLKELADIERRSVSQQVILILEAEKKRQEEIHEPR